MTGFALPATAEFKHYPAKPWRCGLRVPRRRLAGDQQLPLARLGRLETEAKHP